MRYGGTVCKWPFDWSMWITKLRLECAFVYLYTSKPTIIIMRHSSFVIEAKLQMLLYGFTNGIIWFGIWDGFYGMWAQYKDIKREKKNVYFAMYCNDRVIFYSPFYFRGCALQFKSHTSWHTHSSLNAQRNSGYRNCFV